MRISYDGVPVLFAVTCCRYWYYTPCMPLLSSSLFPFFAFHFFHFFTHHRCFAPTVRDTFRGQGFARTEQHRRSLVLFFLKVCWRTRPCAISDGMDIVPQISDVSTKGFVVVQQSAGRCTELTGGYQGRDLLREAADALLAFLKVRKRTR